MTFGATITSGGVRFAVWSGAAERMWVSLFDGAGDRETDRIELSREGAGVFATIVPGLAAGARYGFRADGEYAPERGLWFDPDKLLADPYAVAVDRPYAYDPQLAAPRGAGVNTAALMPKCVATALPEPVAPGPPLFREGGVIYELNVRGFTMVHPDIPPQQRGTVRALAHPAVIAHLAKLRVAAVELMPIVAWIDERHLPPLGLVNAWGYNPVTFMPLDPRIAPGGLAELREAVSALRQAGIGTILDVVFNHTGESDEFGPTLSFRGLEARAYFRHAPDGRLVNDTGTGNTVACDHPRMREMILDTLRHFVDQAGVDGFRFDLAPVLGRGADGFDPDAALLREIAADPVLSDRVLIAEPWDIGPDGYQLGRFPRPFLEWNDRYRDDVRRFWRGDAGALGSLATRLAGSSDIFAQGGETRTRSVNFIAAHDGFTLADVTAYERKHNEANGEKNRDGHNENFSWNNGVEGGTADSAVRDARRRDTKALLATLFASRGTLLLTAGDEFGRSQQGNNNAYAQDNALAWVDWERRDRELEEYVIVLAAMRAETPALSGARFLTGTLGEGGLPDVAWLDFQGEPMREEQWRDPQNRRLVMILAQARVRLAVAINGGREATSCVLPERPGFAWAVLPLADAPQLSWGNDGPIVMQARSVLFVGETAAAGGADGKA
jgi:glycogen debranching enzyme